MKTKVLLLLIIFLAFLTRFYQLGQNPAGINLDEASIGYNAYSILKTAKDQYGELLPIYFRSLDDYKPPLYIYLTVPSVALFGLTEWAVRLPSALLGVLAVWGVYLLAGQLVKNSQRFALLASFLLAILPWHLQFTRTAYEVGSTAFFTTFGLFFLLKGREKNHYLVLSAVLFGLELYLYQASKVFVPLFVVALLLIMRPVIKKIAIFLAVFGLFLIPTVLTSTSGTGLLRFQGTSVFQNIKPHDEMIFYKRVDWFNNDPKSALFFHPDPLEYFDEIANGYLVHFRPDFLFLNRTASRFNYTPRVGLIHLFELPLVLFGFYFLFRRNLRLAGSILLAWVVLAPIPASVTLTLPSSVRSAVIVPSLSLIAAFGAVSLFSLFRYKRLFILAAVPIVVYFFSYYLHMYHVHAKSANSDVWYSGYKEIVLETAALAPSYERVLISNGLDQPLDFFLFFLKYDPKRYLEVDGGRISGGFDATKNHFQNLYFTRFDFGGIPPDSRTLYLGLPKEFPDKAIVLKRFFFLNGQESAWLVRFDHP